MVQSMFSRRSILPLLHLHLQLQLHLQLRLHLRLHLDLDLREVEEDVRACHQTKARYSTSLYE
jgi:hypothetical protein